MGEHWLPQWLQSPASQSNRDVALGSVCEMLCLCVCVCVLTQSNTAHIMAAQCCAYCFEMTPQSAA